MPLAQATTTETAKNDVAPAKNDSDILPVGSSYAMGPATAPITMIVIERYQGLCSPPFS